MKNLQKKPSTHKIPQLNLNFQQCHKPATEIFAQLDSKQQFSFNRQQNCRNDSLLTDLKQKYSQIFNDLKIMKSSDIIQLLLQELEQSQKYKNQVWKYKNKVQSLQQQLTQNKQILKKKREAINLLCQTQSKNLHIIQKLQNKLSKKNQYARDTYYQKKYQQLSIYMNEYIRNINLAQEQFKKIYNSQKNQNIRLNQQIQSINLSYTECYKRCQVLTKKNKYYQLQISQLNQSKNKVKNQLSMYHQQNQMLKKQIQIFQQNIRITDRLQIHLQKQHNQLSSQLDFIRQKICENQSISKDIIQKLQQSSSNCQKVNHDKQKFYQSLKRSKDKCVELEKQLYKLKNTNQQLQQNNKILKKQLEFVSTQRDQLDDDLMSEKLEKQSIRKQLIMLADKVRLMESTYRKQIQQSQKIKGQLYKFWQNKQKKQCAIRDLNPMNTLNQLNSLNTTNNFTNLHTNLLTSMQSSNLNTHNNTITNPNTISNSKILNQIKLNGNQFSQTTISISQKQSKISEWRKKSQHENSIIVHDKQNQLLINVNNHHDSLCQ